MHLTVRAVPGFWSLRTQAIYLALEDAFRDTRRPDFRITEYSVQSNHVHLVAEADDADAGRAA